MEVLQVSSFDYEDLFQHAHDMIHFAQPDGKLLYVNPSWNKVLGYDVRLNSTSIYEILTPESRPLFEAYRAQVLKGNNDNRHIVVEAISKDGRVVVLEGSVSAKYADGKVQYTRGIFRDITSRIKQEHSLKENEYTLQQLINQAPDAIVVIDSDSFVRLWNPKAEAVFGWKSEEALGLQLSDLIVPPQFRRAHNEGMRRYMRTGETNVLGRTIEITAVHKNGHTFHISLTISQTQLKGSTAFVSFIRDITQQKEAEAELHQKTAALETTNLELQQFAFAASHDMQEPLRKIATYVNILQTEVTGISQKHRDYLQRVEVSASRMRSIINDLLNYARESNRQEKNYEAVDLNNLLHYILSDLELLISQKNAKIQLAQLPVVEALSVQMRQLFYNLLHNALKFSKQNTTPEITVSCQKTEFGEKPAVEIKISDNGIGFEPEYAERIFGLFKRLNAKAEYEGSGLGLALCRKIVQGHGGIITATSVPGQGSVFTVLLPLEQMG